MLKHDEIMKTVLMLLDNGFVVDVDSVNAGDEVPVIFTNASVNSQFVSLFVAAPLLYQVIAHSIKAIEGLKKAAEAVRATELVNTYNTLLTTLNAAKNIALAERDLNDLKYDAMLRSHVGTIPN